MSYLESILYSHLDYHIISKNNMCKHANGDYPNRCYCQIEKSTCPRQNAWTCEKACSSYAWCVGYSDKKSGPPGCNLHSTNSTSSSCPPNWVHKPGKIANSANQLVASGSSGSWSCVGKLGKLSK